MKLTGEKMSGTNSRRERWSKVFIQLGVYLTVMATSEYAFGQSISRSAISGSVDAAVTYATDIIQDILLGLLVIYLFSRIFKVLNNPMGLMGDIMVFVGVTVLAVNVETVVRGFIQAVS